MIHTHLVNPDQRGAFFLLVLSFSVIVQVALGIPFASRGAYAILEVMVMYGAWWTLTPLIGLLLGGVMVSCMRRRDPESDLLWRVTTFHTGVMLVGSGVLRLTSGAGDAVGIINGLLAVILIGDGLLIVSERLTRYSWLPLAVLVTNGLLVAGVTLSAIYPVFPHLLPVTRAALLVITLSGVMLSVGIAYRQAYRLLPLLSVPILIPFSYPLGVDGLVPLWVFGVVVIMLPLYWLYQWLYQRLEALALPAGVNRALDIMIIFGLIPLYGINLYFPYDRWHHNFILGPTNDILHGRVLLVDALTQYGVGLNYALAGVFGVFPVLLSYPGFSLLLSLMLVITFILTYGVLRHTIPTIGVPLLVIVVLIITQVYRYIYSPLTNPSLGPLRYGWQYIVTALIVLRLRYPQHPVVILEVIALALAAFWSSDSQLSVWLPYGLVVVWEIWSDRHRLRRLGAVVVRLAVVVGITVALYGGYNQYARIVTGNTPDWTVYQDVLRFYSLATWDGWTFITYYPYVLLALVPFGTIMVVLMMGVFDAHRPDATRYLPILMLAGSGIMQLVYWMRTPFTGNLNPFVIPTAALIGFWFVEIGRHRAAARIVSGVRVSVFYLLLVIIVGHHTRPDISPNGVYTPADALFQAAVTGSVPDFNLNQVTDPPPSYVASHDPRPDILILDAVALIEQVAPNDERIALFIPSETATDVLMRVGKGERFVMSHPNMASYNQPFEPWVLAQPYPVGVGDQIFVSINREQLDPIHQKILSALELKYTFETITVSDGGIAVVQLRE